MTITVTMTDNGDNPTVKFDGVGAFVKLKADPAMIQTVTKEIKIQLVVPTGDGGGQCVVVGGRIFCP